MTNKLRPVEEVVQTLPFAITLTGHEFNSIVSLITQDRSQTASLLVEALEPKSVIELFPDADVMNSDERLSAQVAYKNAYNDAMRHAQTIVRELLMPKKE